MKAKTAPSCIQAVSNSWERMMNLLFRPFDMETWFVMGFGAWLASLGRSGGGGGNYNFGSGGPEEFGEVSGAMKEAWVSIQPYLSLIITVGAVAFVFLLIIGLVIGWISARGRFVLLDNVLTGQARVKIPWNAYREEAFSLFLFELVFGLILAGIALGAVAAIVLPMAPFLLNEGSGSFGEVMRLSLPSLLVGIPVFVLTITFGGIVSHLLENFIIPIMAARRMRVRAAFACFLPILRAHLGGFVVYAFLRIGLTMAVMSAVIMFGFMTCCCGFLILAIPYIGAVVTLPIAVLLRGMGPDYLAKIQQSDS